MSTCELTLNTAWMGVEGVCVCRFGDPEGPLKILRLLRAFRPLRMVNRIDGMKLVIMSLVSAAPALSNVCILLASVFLIFGILGLSLFMGKFHSCNDAEDEFIGGSDKIHCFGHFEGDFWGPRVWSNPTLDGFGRCSFDNIWDSFMALFEVASGDSWETVSLIVSLIDSQSHTHTHSLSLVLVAVMKSKELKTKTSHAHSLILSH